MQRQGYSWSRIKSAWDEEARPNHQRLAAYLAFVAALLRDLDIRHTAWTAQLGVIKGRSPHLPLASPMPIDPEAATYRVVTW